MPFEGKWEMGTGLVLSFFLGGDLGAPDVLTLQAAGTKPAREMEAGIELRASRAYTACN